MSVYRTRTYIAADFDNDRNAVDQLHKWSDSNFWSLSFQDAHELQSSSDNSLYCSIKASLKNRMNHSNTFVLIVGSYTDTITKGGCQYCASYNSYTRACARGHSIDYSSYIEYECKIAIEAGIKIIVLYNGIRVNKSICPHIIRDIGIHKAMKYYNNGTYYWDYNAVKEAFDED